MAKKKLGELLIDRGMIDEDQLASALAYQRQWGHRLGAALLAKGFVSEAELCKALSEELFIPLVDLVEIEPDMRAVRLLKAPFCESHELFPYALDEARGRRRLSCAMSDPLNIAAVDEIEFTTGCKVLAKLAPLSQIHSAIRRYYMGSQASINRPESRRGASAAGPEGDMVVMRPGGVEETVHTSLGKVATARQEAVNLLDESEIFPLTQEVTARTALADMVEAREKGERAGRRTSETLRDDLDFLFGVSTQDQDRLDKLERMFWGLVRVMAKKGQITKEEFLAALGESQGEG